MPLPAEPNLYVPALLISAVVIEWLAFASNDATLFSEVSTKFKILSVVPEDLATTVILQAPVVANSMYL